MASARCLVVVSVVLIAVSATCALTQADREQRKVVATGAVADLDQANRTVVFSGGAKLTTNEGSISAREIEARLGEGDTIEMAEARGGVKMSFHYTSKDGVERTTEATADRAVYDATERTVQLLGDVIAQLREPAHKRTLDLSADEVMFWIDESRLRIRPARLVFTEMVKPEAEAAPVKK